MASVGGLIALLIGRATNLGWWWAIGCTITVFLIYFVVYLLFGENSEKRGSE
jgi:hypothetical protein